MEDRKKSNYGYQPEQRGYQPMGKIGNGYQPTTLQGGGKSVPPTGGSNVKPPQSTNNKK